MKLAKSSMVIGLITIFVFFVHLSVFAQEGQPAEDEGTKEEKSSTSEDFQENKDETVYELHNIVVTAQKREEKIQDVPASVTAFNLKEIEDAGIKSTADIYSYVPNLTSFGLASGGIGFSYYGMRGQTNFNSYSNSIGIYIDDVLLRLTIFDLLFPQSGVPHYLI